MQCMLMEHYGLAQNQVSMAYNLLPPQHILCVRCVCVCVGGGGLQFVYSHDSRLSERDYFVLSSVVKV